MTSVFNVSGMSCSKCVDKIEKSIGAIDGVEFIDVNLEQGSVTVEHLENVDPSRIRTAIEEVGYKIV